MALGIAIAYFRFSDYEIIIGPIFVNGKQILKLEGYLIAFLIFHLLVVGVGLLLCKLSSQLDFIDKNDDRAGNLISLIITFLIIGILSIIIFDVMNYRTSRWLKDVFHENPSITNFFITIFSLIFYTIGIIFKSLCALFGTFFVLALPPLALGTAFAGVLCIPRAFIYSTTGHKLRGAVTEVGGGVKVDPARVVAGVGQKSTSAAQAVALRKDLDAQLGRMHQIRARLKKEEERLSKDIHHDTKRLENEAEAMRIAEEIDTLELRIKLIKEEKRKTTP